VILNTGPMTDADMVEFWREWEGRFPEIHWRPPEADPTVGPRQPLPLAGEAGGDGQPLDPVL
jgi:hypothetical protein